MLARLVSAIIDSDSKDIDATDATNLNRHLEQKLSTEARVRGARQCIAPLLRTAPLPGTTFCPLLTIPTRTLMQAAQACLERLSQSKWLSTTAEGYQLGVRTELQRRFTTEEPTQGDVY